jgi:hypothetical protein
VTKIPVWASVRKYKKVGSKKVFKVKTLRKGKKCVDEAPAWWGINKKE